LDRCEIETGRSPVGGETIRCGGSAKGRKYSGIGGERRVMGETSRRAIGEARSHELSLFACSKIQGFFSNLELFESPDM
jgi:hypothetical protein